jgi:hypothetical protein
MLSRVTNVLTRPTRQIERPSADWISEPRHFNPREPRLA